MPQLLDDHIVDQSRKIEELEARLKAIERYVHFVNNDIIAFGTHDGYIQFHTGGHIFITGYSKETNRLVTVNFDQIINKVL